MGKPTFDLCYSKEAVGTTGQDGTTSGPERNGRRRLMGKHELV